MAIHQALEGAMRTDDYEGYLKLLHADYEFVRHQTGVTVSLDEWKPVVLGMFEAKKAGNLNWETSRCLYENEDILVMHNVMGFPDGSKEAVMVVHILKDGKILKTETRATPIE